MLQHILDLFLPGSADQATQTNLSSRYITHFVRSLKRVSQVKPVSFCPNREDAMQQSVCLPGEMKKVLHSFLSRVTSLISLVMLTSRPATGGTLRKSRILQKERGYNEEDFMILESQVWVCSVSLCPEQMQPKNIFRLQLNLPWCPRWCSISKHLLLTRRAANGKHPFLFALSVVNRI